MALCLLNHFLHCSYPDLSQALHAEASNDLLEGQHPSIVRRHDKASFAVSRLLGEWVTARFVFDKPISLNFLKEPSIGDPEVFSGMET